MEMLQAVLVGISSSAFTLLVLWWLAKSLIHHMLAKEFERFKTDLLAESSRNQFSFSKMHERKLEAIETLHGLVVEVQDAIYRFTSPAGGEHGQFITAHEKIQGFRKLFAQKRIFLSPAICTQLEGFVNGIEDQANELGKFILMGEPMALEKDLEVEMLDTWVKVSKYFEIEAPKASDALVAEFRRAIGSSEV